jgi:hypothetical protein
MNDYCLIFRIEEKTFLERNELIDLLKKNKFEWTESTGSKACFNDENYEKFSKICLNFAKENKTSVETFRMIDPGMGLIYELYFDHKYKLSKGYPILSTFKLPKEVSNYNSFK